MKTTYVLLALASLIAIVACAKMFCNSVRDCGHCLSPNETLHCGIPMHGDITHSDHGDPHIGNFCHCLAPLSHCAGSCRSLICRSHTVMGITVHKQRLCAEGRCQCFVYRPQHHS